MLVGQPGRVPVSKVVLTYLIEFFMLFLAVFLGFFAENYRDRLTDRNRENDFMISMTEDLRQDTLKLQVVIDATTRQLAYSDTLLDILELEKLSQEELNKAYHFVYYAVSGDPVLFSQRSLSQLKNAGYMRLIRNTVISDSLNVYDAQIQYIGSVYDMLDESVHEVLNASTGLFDNRYVRTPQRVIDLREGRLNAQLMTQDAMKRRQFSNYVSISMVVKRFYIRRLKEQKELATRLLERIEESY